MKSKKRVGPKREPWGTPALILWASDVWPFTTTVVPFGVDEQQVVSLRAWKRDGHPFLSSFLVLAQQLVLFWVIRQQVASLAVAAPKGARGLQPPP